MSGENQPRPLLGPAAVLVAVLAGLAAGAMTIFAADAASRSLLPGNGALAVVFSLGPAGAAAVWLALLLWWQARTPWLGPALLAFSVGTAGGLFAQFAPFLLWQLGITQPQGAAVAYPAVGLLAGLGLADLLGRLNRRAVVVALIVALLTLVEGLGLPGYFWTISPLLLLPALALPAGLARWRAGPVVSRPARIWLWLALALVPLAVGVGIVFLGR